MKAKFTDDDWALNMQKERGATGCFLQRPTTTSCCGRGGFGGLFPALGEKRFEFGRTEVGQNFTGPVQDGCLGLAGEALHLGGCGRVIGHDLFFVGDAATVEDLTGLGAPRATELGVENRTR